MSPTDQASFGLDELNGCSVVMASGEIDLYTAPALREALLVAVRSTASRIVVDLRGVTFLDLTGLGLLVATRRRMHAADGSVCLVGPVPAVRRILRITRLDDAFETYEDLAKGVA